MYDTISCPFQPNIIIGISVGAAVGLVAVLCCCFVGLFAMSSEKRRESATTTAAHPKAVERKSPRKGSRNSSLRNTTDPDSPPKSKRKASETGKKSKPVKQDKGIEEGDIELAVSYSLNQRVDLLFTSTHKVRPHILFLLKFPNNQIMFLSLQQQVLTF
jgi:hypothetical protein